MGDGMVSLCRGTSDGDHIKPQGNLSRPQQWRELPKARAAYPSWSRDGKYIYYYEQTQIYRVSVIDGEIKPIANIYGLRRASGGAGNWMGLTPDDAPMLLRDVGKQDIYALDWMIQ
jgi:hypothetical protein